MGPRCAEILIALVLAVIPPVSFAQSNRPLTNQDVVQMVRAGFQDPTIIKYMQANDVNFDLSVPAMVALKNAGVNQSLIQAMLSIAIAKKAINGTAALQAIAASSSDSSDGIRFFALQAGKLTELEPETVKWRSTGGGFKSMATLGMSKGSTIGTVSGPQGQFTVAWPPLNMVPLDVDFYIVSADDSVASGFQLLHLWARGDHREFRTSASNASSGGGSDTVAFTLTVTDPRIYKITLPNLSVGEYGFLAPETQVNSNSAPQGKIYTFRVVE
jgi:hypothetical protein